MYGNGVVMVSRCALYLYVCCKAIGTSHERVRMKGQEAEEGLFFQDWK